MSIIRRNFLNHNATTMLFGKKIIAGQTIEAIIKDVGLRSGRAVFHAGNWKLQHYNSKSNKMEAYNFDQLV